MLGFVFATGFAFELGFNGAMNKYWDYLNRGVSIDEPASRETATSLRKHVWSHGRDGFADKEPNVASMEGHPPQVRRGRR
ncbi:hypothetical protein CGRA01v4_05127 [Colletotrichum graminicola]|nr:hypothetical protein CGRA01v4_05127 [Colletotrichum graminicola]